MRSIMAGKQDTECLLLFTFYYFPFPVVVPCFLLHTPTHNNDMDMDMDMEEEEAPVFIWFFVPVVAVIRQCSFSFFCLASAACQPLFLS